jgi:ATP-dependent Clp protease ATP-binding subunit ClpB
VLDVTPEAREKLVELGYEPSLGARPIKRTILQKLQDPLAEALLGGTIPDGSRVLARLDGDQFVFEKVG